MKHTELFETIDWKTISNMRVVQTYKGIDIEEFTLIDERYHPKRYITNKSGVIFTKAVHAKRAIDFYLSYDETYMDQF